MRATLATRHHTASGCGLGTATCRVGMSDLELLRAEIRYRLEMCPCSSVDDNYVQLRVEEH